jgi:cell division septation protein DedD
MKKPKVKTTTDCEHGMPKFLCRACTPQKPSLQTGSVALVKPEPRRDFRIPKGMSTEEGNAMLAQREAEKASKNKRALSGLKEKHQAEFVRINLLRDFNGLQPLPENMIRKFKTDPVKNNLLFSRVIINGETDMTTTTTTKTNGEAVKTAKPTVEKKAAAAAKPAAKAKSTAKPEPAAKAKSKPAAKPEGKGKKSGAFTAEVTAMLIGMLKKGTTAKQMIDAAKWGGCPNPLKRVNRFVTSVAEKQHKLKISIEGRGEESLYSTE